ncbi:hypothetical protein GCM10007079_46870 [Nocardiopsis terrae]|nr:hypothetical protein GCM10007079_46870 [Nocardiopsis terrae]
MTSNDLVVVLTALNLEYEAVRERLASPELYRHPRGTRFEVGSLPGGRGRVVLGLTGKGNQSSAVLTERAIQEFSPAALLFVGVAGALWDTPLGDVVVGTHVYAYHGGTSEDDGLKARPRAWESPHEISQTAAHLARTGSWDRFTPAERPRPRVHFGPIAAGEVVQNSRVSHEAEWIRQTFNDALAVEMEGAGIAQAGHLSATPVAVVRGISDRADGAKATEADRKWQPIAAANAAAFALELATELIEAEPPSMRENSTPPRLRQCHQHRPWQRRGPGRSRQRRHVPRGAQLRRARPRRSSRPARCAAGGSVPGALRGPHRRGDPRGGLERTRHREQGNRGGHASGQEDLAAGPEATHGAPG